MKDFRTKINYRERNYLNRRKMFIKNNKHSQENLFGFLMYAFKYAAPSQGGIAFGFDMMVMLFAGESSISDTITFPKTTSALSLMVESPSEVNDEQLKELHRKLREK